MTINHHLSDALLMAYSAGTLPEAFSLVVATHVSLCDECRARLGSYDAVGGALLEASGSVPMNDDAFDSLLARLDEGAPVEASRPAPARGCDVPTPLDDYIDGSLEDVPWKSVGGGVRQAVIARGAGATARLIHIPAGAKVPDHGHHGTEVTLVLKGAYRDAEGRYASGDVEVADASMEHMPVAEAGEDCVCLTATDARLRFHGFLPRIAQPFLGI